MGRAGKDVGREMREEIEGKKKKRSVYKGREEVKKKNKVIKR